VTDQKKFYDNKCVGLESLREEDKINYGPQGKRFDEINLSLKDTNKKYNNLKYDYDELNVKDNKLMIQY